MKHIKAPSSRRIPPANCEPQRFQQSFEVKWLQDALLGFWFGGLGFWGLGFGVNEKALLSRSVRWHTIQKRFRVWGLGLGPWVSGLGLRV